MLPNEAPSQEFNQIPTNSEQLAKQGSLNPEYSVSTETEFVSTVSQDGLSTESIVNLQGSPAVEAQLTPEALAEQYHKSILTITVYVTAMRHSAIGVPR